MRDIFESIYINKVWKDVDWKYSKAVPFDIPSSYAACLTR